MTCAPGATPYLNFKLKTFKDDNYFIKFVSNSNREQLRAKIVSNTIKNIKNSERWPDFKIKYQ